MSKPYSYDLCQKVIQALKLDGLKISGSCVLLFYSVLVVTRDRLWFSRQAETGDFQALLGPASR